MKDQEIEPKEYRFKIYGRVQDIQDQNNTLISIRKPNINTKLMFYSKTDNRLFSIFTKKQLNFIIEYYFPFLNDSNAKHFARYLEDLILQEYSIVRTLESKELEKQYSNVFLVDIYGISHLTKNSPDYKISCSIELGIGLDRGQGSKLFFWEKYPQVLIGYPCKAYFHADDPEENNTEYEYINPIDFEDKIRNSLKMLQKGSLITFEGTLVTSTGKTLTFQDFKNRDYPIKLDPITSSSGFDILKTISPGIKEPNWKHQIKSFWRKRISYSKLGIWFKKSWILTSLGILSLIITIKSWVLWIPSIFKFIKNFF